MSLFAHLGHAAVVAATLSSAGPTGLVRQADRGLHQVGDYGRVWDLMEPLARAVLGSADREELEFNIDEQLFSGLFADLVTRSIQTVARQPRVDVTNEFDGQFLSVVERLGGKRDAASRALSLSQIAARISLRLIDASGVERELEDLSFFDMHEFLYDIEAPLELRKAAQADFESAICMIALAHAVAAREEPPAWLVAELVDRWLEGQLNSLPLLTSIALEMGLRPEDALTERQLIELDELSEKQGFDLFAEAEKAARDLAAERKRAETMTEQLHAIAEHASRQPDGVWPKK
jgi:hypothetical protein